MNTKELKSCPFCGNSVYIRQNDEGSEQIYCLNCGAKTSWSMDARILWNNRVTPKACPICGGKTKIQETFGGIYYVECSESGLTGKHSKNRKLAELLWNAMVDDSFPSY